MVEFRECQPGQHHAECSGLHVRWESEEQRRMVFECRERARRVREESQARRSRFRETGVWR